ncbi:MAG: hypothetical protein ABIQ66_03710 [Novosphingobium sp.]
MSHVQTPSQSLPDWTGRLSEHALACAGAYPSEQARRLRELRELLASAPDAAARLGSNVPEPAIFAAMLRAEAWESAALSLLGDDAGYMLSRGPAGRHMASVMLPGRPEESTATADTAALALAAALAMALQDGPLRYGDMGDAASPTPMRLN